ncbi:MAG: biotin/lipoyl-binding protein [Proteobacteria bacterium]|nr:biotin/lipoyl-binding protein [Pseudomonadota bacterium]
MLVIVLVSGTAFALERKLAFPVSGVVAKVMVTAGQPIKAGAPLARLDTRPLEAEKSAADAALVAANRKLEILSKNRDRVRQLFDDLSASGEQVELAEIQFVEAQAQQAHAKAMAVIAAWRLGQATLRAPEDGTVTAVRGYSGLVVNPAAEITAIIILSTP